MSVEIWTLEFILERSQMKGTVIENWKKGSLSYKAAKILAELCYSVLWKVELVSDEIGHLAKENFK